MKKIYAVACGRQTGLFDTWAECEKNVRGYPGAKFKGFTDKHEALAWLGNPAPTPQNPTAPYAPDYPNNSATDNDVDYVIFTDGSCLKNPGAGGWAAVITETKTGATRELKGGEAMTTNNRMEMCAAVNALATTAENARIKLYTDSQYLKNAFTKYWLRNWKRNGWQTSTGEPVKNRELWEKLDALVSSRHINFQWVKGHAGNRYNERCDELARTEAAKFVGCQKP